MQDIGHTVTMCQAKFDAVRDWIDNRYILVISNYPPPETRSAAYRGRKAEGRWVIWVRYLRLGPNQILDPYQSSRDIQKQSEALFLKALF